MTNLKKPEEYIHEYMDVKVASVIIEIIKQVQKDTYNQAIDNAYLNARIMRVKYDDEIPGVVIDKKSILKLKI